MELNNKLEAQQFEIKNFTYDLPENRIAKYPLAERDLSKLLVYHNGEISEDIYRNLDKYIFEKSIFIFNNTKVVQSRLYFNNSTGGKIEVFCLEPSEKNHEPSMAMMKKTCVEWKCLIGRLDRWKEKVISINTKDISLDAEILERDGNVFTIRFSWQPTSFSFAEILEHFGAMPIPPYLKRESEEIDVSRYQTVYAEQQGSVAAPTAGLHFTNQIFEKIKSKNAIVDYVTLHVGAGTFIPVKSETLEGHQMHSEWIEVAQETILNIVAQISDEQTNKNVIAIGTTSLRTIESLYWMGVKANQNMSASIDELEVKQWDAYELQQSLTASDALNCLLAWLKRNKIEKIICKTQLLIVPSYQLKIANALITNFHQPSSTLLLLVAAVVGDDWKVIYDYALKNDFRFLSYGDGSLLFDNKRNKN
ncbi:S-adenosylmethionine:tRNA ribosyltransferase-isomerase [Pedobacter aquae]|uniref:S-adenosylmethionine:tRNA ribosyltransferase-isomerase n=1 Tax=Pedobacter aquae TaxID=2605747 RepID=A0A5C0VHL7_9SPHI|nr:S-adenosylmethionine:tRNA ribosyltransferase-isomerase [Pedobacter aquae]QEK52145.1 S-adenosylmethionine:tRNA ribosyltransferase-isomerase [Pedobacter aquae]